MTNFTHTYEAFDQDGNGTNEAAGVARYAYTSGDRLARRTWARGEITNYIYHPSTGDLLYTDYGTNTDTRDLAYTYDRLGRVAEVTGGTLSGSPSYAVTNLTGNGTRIHARIHRLRPAEPATTQALARMGLGRICMIPQPTGGIGERMRCFKSMGFSSSGS